MKDDALKIIASALKAADPYKNTYTALISKQYSECVTVISVGKAACTMAQAAYDALGDKIKQGFVLTKYGYSKEMPQVFTVREAGHPIPDENSVKYTCEIIESAEKLTKDEKIVFLLSGGGSALFEAPLIPLDMLRHMTDAMLKSGADINEINAIRKLFSLVKGGKFTQYCRCKIDCYILSDVIGDDPCIIASGPCCASKDDLPTGLDIFNKYLDVMSIDSVLLKKIHNSFKIYEAKNTEICIIGNVESLCKGVADEAKLLGYDAVTVTTSLKGEAKTQAERIIDKALIFASAPHKPTVFIYGGETTVTVRGSGKGGRNQEAALAAAIKLKNTKDILFFALGSDGTDGPTDAAGGFADGESYLKMKNNNIDPHKYLDNNDSYNALKS